MSKLTSRIDRLEKVSGQQPQRLSLAELERRVNFVLKYPQAVSEQVYNRIVEILENCRRRKADHEQLEKQD